MEKYYLNYLRQHAEDPLIEKYIRLLKAELDWHIYATGNDIAPRYNRNPPRSFISRSYSFCQRLSGLLSPCSKRGDYNQVLSFFRFPVSIEGVKFFSSIVHPVGLRDIVGSINSLHHSLYLERVIQKYPFNLTISRDVLSQLEKDIDCLDDMYFRKNNFQAVFLYTDQLFSSKQHIDLFRKRQKPSFIFSHGLPGVYSTDVDNYSDYLMVWGEKIKQNYIDAGFDSRKIEVIGNFKKTRVDVPKSLRNGFEDVLVITTSSSNWHQNTWGTPTPCDTGLFLLFIYEVQDVLIKMGIKHARLRPHPSVNKEWLKEFIDWRFYSFDNDDLNSSLNNSSLVIGPTSSVAIDAMLNGVNYLVYEPEDENGLTRSNGMAVPPFDGKDPNLYCAKNQEELLYFLRNRYCSNPHLLNEYIEPFNPGVINRLLKSI